MTVIKRFKKLTFKHYLGTPDMEYIRLIKLLLSIYKKLQLKSVVSISEIVN